MNALHQAVARAIADAYYKHQYASDTSAPQAAAAAAVGVCLAEAQRAMEAAPHGWAETGADDGQGHREGFEAIALATALAALAALAEEQA